MIALYMRHVERLGRSPRTLAYYRIKAKALGVLGERDVHELRLGDVERYVDERLADKVSLATAAKELGLLQSALRYARRRGYYHGEPASLRPDRLHGTYVPRDRALSHAEYRQVLLALPESRRDYLLVLCGLGVRLGELYRLERADVVGDRVHVRGRKTSRADRWVAAPPEVLAVLRRRGVGFPGVLFPVWHSLRRDLRAACKRAGVDPISPNDCRRTFASWLGEGGVPELTTASLLGHASSAMVRRVYSRIGAAAQTAAMTVLPPLQLAVPVGKR